GRCCAGYGRGRGRRGEGGEQTDRLRVQFWRCPLHRQGNQRRKLMAEQPDKLHKWELVHSHQGSASTERTERMRVPGGWLYLHTASWDRSGDPAHRETMIFVPDVGG